MTEYLDRWRKSLKGIEMRVSRPKTQCMDFTHCKYHGASID